MRGWDLVLGDWLRVDEWLLWVLLLGLSVWVRGCEGVVGGLLGRLSS